MRAYLKKRGSLSLSINAIVVLIMAITMLGLGLAFMRNVFSEARESLEGATAEIEKQTIDSLKTSGKKVAVSQASIELGPRERKSIIIAVTNTEDSPLRYGVEYTVLGCSGTYSGEPLCSNGNIPVGETGFDSDALKLITVQNMGTILQDGAKTVTFSSETTSSVEAGTMTIEIKVCQEDSSGSIDCLGDNSNLHGTETITLTSRPT